MWFQLILFISLILDRGYAQTKLSLSLLWLFETKSCPIQGVELQALWHLPSLPAAQSVEGAVWHRATIVLPLLMPSTPPAPWPPLPPSGDTGVTKAVSSSGGRQPSYTISCRGRHTKGGRGGTEGGLKVDPEENQDKQRVGVEQNQKLRLPVDSRTYWFCPGTNKKRKFNWSLSLIQSLRSGRSILRKTKTSREATCRKSAQKNTATSTICDWMCLMETQGRSWGKPRQTERRLAVKAKKKHSDKYSLWLDVYDGNWRVILSET